MSLRASTMSGARSSIMLAARNAGLAMLPAFATGSRTSRSAMIDILRAGAGRLINFGPRAVNERNRKAVIERNSVWRVMRAHGGYAMTEIKEHMEVIGADG